MISKFPVADDHAEFHAPLLFQHGANGCRYRGVCVGGQGPRERSLVRGSRPTSSANSYLKSLHFIAGPVPALTSAEALARAPTCNLRSFENVPTALPLSY